MKFRDISRKIRAPLNRKTAFSKLEKFHSQQRSTDEIVDMALDFGTRGLYRVDSVQIRSEILSLVNAVKSINPKTILEIGTCNGGTLFMWANLASERVITCDLNVSKIRDELYCRFTPPDSKCKVISLSGDSHNADFNKRVVEQLNGNMVDFLFIDGDHTEKGAMSDYMDYKDIVRPGGLIAFHDIVKEQPTPNNQVYYVWEKLKEDCETEEFVNDHAQTGFGIGVIHVN